MSSELLTLRALFETAFAKHRNRPALVADGVEWTYGQLDREADRLAHGLRERGVVPGTAVALMLPNGAEFVIADLALIKLGAAKVPLNDMLVDEECRYVLRDSGALAAVASAPRAEVAAEILAEDGPLQEVVVVGPAGSCPPGTSAWDEVLSGHPDSAPSATVSEGDRGLLLYTGGTTGRPKGVVHQQRQLALNLLAHRLETELRSDDRLLLTSPLPHSAGFLLQTGLLAGAVTHLEAGFDPGRVLDAVEGEAITFLFLVPTMIYRLLDRLADTPRDVTGLRTILYGAAPMSVDRLAEGLERFGPVFVQLYGQSEAPNFITRLPREAHITGPEGANRLTSCGQPAAMCRVEVLDDQGHRVPPGVPGEVVVQTPYTMVGYHGRPDATEQALQDGWLRTGDIGYLDEEQYLYLVDRKNDMIITGGLNVYCTEVETVIAQLDGVREVAVIGVPHPDWGEAVVACVVPEQPGTLDPQAVTDHCRAVMASYKRPKHVVELAAIPLTPYGKADKKKLRATCAQPWSTSPGLGALSSQGVTP
jgi:fatty-acyl-CoA synthase